jgi:hypothetical protein
MSQVTRREFLRLSGRTAAGAFLLQVPLALYRSPWLESAAAQTPPTVAAAFTALVEAVTTDADEETAAWIIGEFDRALPPLPDGSPSAAVAAVLDAYTLAGAHGIAFALVSPEARREVLAALIHDDDPDIRQIGNQILPFAGFAYWSDATLPAPAEPDGDRLPRWDEIAWPGPTHSYLDIYEDDGPPGFRSRATIWRGRGGERRDG